jgi:YjbE family integral membrane protein
MTEFFIALAKIMMVNIVLSGDNAVVIALACRNLEKKHRKVAILAGSGGAIVLRILLTLVAVILLQIPYLQFFGGVLLIWIAVKLLIEKDEDESKHHAHSHLWGAIKTIIIADIVMSLDNTLAIAAIAEGNYMLLGLGLALSIPLIVFGSQLIMVLMERFPIIVYIGAGLIAWTAGEMMGKDPKISIYFSDVIKHFISPVVTVIVVGGCLLYNRKKHRTAHDVLVADEHAAERLEDKID